jgi:hypothetical protein
MIYKNSQQSISSITKILFTLSLISCLVEAKEWRGIKPLHTSRQEVESILGVKSEGRSLEWYNLPGVTVMISYTTLPCGNDEHGKWNVPPNTVISIGVTERNAVDFSSLHLDLRAFEKKRTDVDSITEYISKQLGWKLVVVNGKCRDFDYYATKEDIERLACRKN